MEANSIFGISLHSPGSDVDAVDPTQLRLVPEEDGDDLQDRVGEVTGEGMAIRKVIRTFSGDAAINGDDGAGEEMGSVVDLVKDC